MLLLSFRYPCSVSLPRGAVGLSVVFLSYLHVLVVVLVKACWHLCILSVLSCIPLADPEGIRGVA